MLSRVLHIMCLIKCLSGIFELFWTPMSSKFWDYSWLNLFNMFWSLGVCFTHFDPTCAHTCLAMHYLMHTLCTLHAHTCTVVNFFFLHFNDYYMFYHLKHVHLILLCSVLSIVFLFWNNLTLIKFLLLFCVSFAPAFYCCVFTCVDVSHQASCFQEANQVSTHGLQQLQICWCRYGI